MTIQTRIAFFQKKVPRWFWNMNEDWIYANKVKRVKAGCWTRQAWR